MIKYKLLQFIKPHDLIKNKGFNGNNLIYINVILVCL